MNEINFVYNFSVNNGYPVKAPLCMSVYHAYIPGSPIHTLALLGPLLLTWINFTPSMDK